MPIRRFLIAGPALAVAAALFAAPACKGKGAAPLDAGAPSAPTRAEVVDAGPALDPSLAPRGPALRSAGECDPGVLLAQGRTRGVARVVVRGRGFDVDVADAPAICGEAAPGRARGRGGWMLAACAGELRFRAWSSEALAGEIPLGSATDGGAMVDVTLRAGGQDFEIDRRAPARLQLEGAGKVATLRATLRRVDNPIQKLSFEIDARCR